MASVSYGVCVSCQESGPLLCGSSMQMLCVSCYKQDSVTIDRPAPRLYHPNTYVSPLSSAAAAAADVKSTPPIDDGLKHDSIRCYICSQLICCGDNWCNAEIPHDQRCYKCGGR